MLALAIDDRTEVLARVEERMRAVELIQRTLADVGAPVVSPAAAHCVLIDTARMAALQSSRHPLAACLAWLFARAGVRAAPHLAGLLPDAPLARCIRLAVPLGTTLDEARLLASRLALLFAEPGQIEDLELVEADAGTGPAERRYRLVGSAPAAAPRRWSYGSGARDENARVVREHCPSAERRLIRLGEGEVEAFVCGRGPTLVLMHPFNIGAGYFIHQIEALARQWRVVVVHHPGVGATTLAHDLTLDGLAVMLKQALGALDVSWPAHIAGCSVAGLIAQAFALRYPASAATLTLVCSSYRAGNRSGPIAPLSQVLEEDLENMRAGADRVGDWDEVKEILLRSESMDPQIGLRYLDEFDEVPDLLSRLPELRLPTLIIQGGRDSVIPEATRRTLREAIPHAKYVELESAGHFPCLTHASEFNQVLGGFLVEHERTARAHAEIARPAAAPPARAANVSQ